MAKTCIAIPARIGSTRLKNKMILNIDGRSLLQHTYENACKSKLRVYIITPDNEIVQHARKFMSTDDIIKCQSHSRSGSHAIGMSLHRLDADRIINIQGDCPNFNVNYIPKICSLMPYYDDVVTGYYLSKDGSGPERSKIVTNHRNEAIYFSRSPVPYGAAEYKIHIGFYAGFKNVFHIDDEVYNSSERLEQLFWVENSEYRFNCIKMKKCFSIDTQKDLDEYKEWYNEQHNSSGE